MNIKHLILVGATSALSVFGANANAQTSMAACLSTPVVEFNGTVVDAALATPELSTLVDAVVAAGLVDALNDAENITVYAPTNAAFGNLPEDVLGAVLADTDLLTGVLTYHVTEGVNDPRRFATAERKNTLSGQTVFYQRRGNEARVNQAVVNCQGVSTDNGNVWLIDSVLMPQF